MGKDEVAEYRHILKKHKDEFDKNWHKRSSATKNHKTNHDFQMYQTLGRGAFGSVILAKDRSSKKFYAIKILSKEKIVKHGQIQHTLNEKHILSSINFPFAVFMEYSFKNNSYIYFVLPYVNGGDMYTHLRRKIKFDEALAKFYAAQVLLTLEYLHHLNLIYRDLKPENILIDCTGYLKVTDFGFCKMVAGRTWTFCGTPEYIAPEIISSKGYGKSVDWWSFGVLIYEMSAGYSPFYSHLTIRIYEKISRGKFNYSQHFSTDLKDLLHHILQTDLSRRYGNLKNGADDIKTHGWFKEINWLHIYHRKIHPPFKPTCHSSGDATNFDSYREETLKESLVDHYKTEFKDF